jgi:hypothetical protein
MPYGFIKLHRKFLNWEWYSDLNTKSLFLHCILRANHTDTKWRGINIKKGSFITSLPKLHQQTGLSIQNIRTSINKLKSTGELTDKTSNKNRIITITNWNLYQNTNRQTNRQLTDNQQTTNRQLTADKNNKNENNDKNDKKSIKAKFGEFKNVKLTKIEFEKLIQIYHGNHDLLKAIEILDSYIETKGKKYKSHYAVLGKTNWVYERVYKDSKPIQKSQRRKNAETMAEELGLMRGDYVK